jgi:hypothetical protein
MRILAMRGRLGDRGEFGECISPAISLKLVGTLEKNLEILSVFAFICFIVKRLNGDRGRGE